MIKVYNDATKFIDNNDAYLKENEYLSSFFYIDAKQMKVFDSKNYAIECIEDNKKLLAIRLEPFNVVFYGDNSLTEELIDYLISNNYWMDEYLTSCIIGDKLVNILKEKYNLDYYEALAMDFMEAKEITYPSSNEIVHATLDDVDDIYECSLLFCKECNLTDAVLKERIMKEIDSYRLIKKENQIASMLKICYSTNNSLKIAAVYTRKEYRKQGLSEKLVISAKNEIINSKKIATLNVDRNNPITNYFYRKVGFKQIFSQGSYRKK